MTKKMAGWCGKILEINLGNRKIKTLETKVYASRFLGGRGIATKIYADKIKPSTKAFDPENCLIFMTGPLGATGVQGASRMSVVSKSPMLNPEGFCYGNLGGFFPPFLKKAGWDGLIITGVSDHPCFLKINNDSIEILSADDLWGHGFYRLKKIFENRYGKNNYFLTTGIAGENKCRNATINSNNEGSVTGGFGAVMGSKKLKAIVVNGDSSPQVAYPEKLKKLNQLTIKMSHRGTLRMPVPKQFIKYTGKASCYQCAFDCIRGKFKTSSGQEVIRKCQSLVMYMPWAYTRPNEPADTAVEATYLCNDYSLCSMEVMNILVWLQNCYRSGFLNDDKTGLEIKKIGSYDFISKLLSQIANRQGFGEALAEGLLRVDLFLGKEAKNYFNENMLSVGMTDAYAPRLYNINALLYALEPRQPIAMLHEVSYLIAHWLLNQINPKLSPTSSEIFRKAATLFWGHDKAWDLTSYEGKAMATKKIQDRTYVKDSLVLCDSAWPIMDSFNTSNHVGDPTLESQLFSTVTGLKNNEEELNLYGERIFNLQRSILLKEGWNPKEDDFPAEYNFQKPVTSDLFNPQLIVPGPTEEPVSIKNFFLSKEKFTTMQQEFYQLRGWDPETGLQKKETLEKLDLPELIK